MKYLIVLCCILFFSCKNNSREEKVESTIDSNSELKQSEPSKSAYEIALLKMDSTIRTLCDTNFLFEEIDTVNINDSKCPFKPYMLVVNDGKLNILNNSLDSLYKIEIKNEVHTASWSPFNDNEIFILLREKINMSKSDSTGFPFCCLKAPFDLKLYRLNLDSLKMYRVTSFFNKMLPLIRLQYELGEFFPTDAVLKIDTEGNTIFYDAISVMIDYDYFENKGTYKVNLDTRETILTKPIKYKQEKKVGIIEKIFSNAYHQKNNFKAKFDGKVIHIYDIPSKDETIEISSKLFEGNEQMNVPNFKPDTLLNELQFNFCYTNNPNFLIGSPYVEEEMAVLRGNIYLMDKHTQVFTEILKNRVIGYSADLFALDNGMYIIRTYWEMQIYDKAFSLKYKFPKIQHYELK